MLIRLRDLTSLTVQSEDGASHRVADLLVRRDAPVVTHVVTRLGGWLARRGCAVRVGAMGLPDLSDRVWPAAINEAAVEKAGSGGAVAVLCAPDALPDPSDVAATEGIAPLAALSSIDGKPVMAEDGRTVGTIMDLVVDVEGHRVTMMVVEVDGTQRVVPVRALDRVDWDAGTVHLTCAAERVGSAPDLHEVGDEIEGHWYNRVLAYYGFG